MLANELRLLAAGVAGVAATAAAGIAYQLFLRPLPRTRGRLTIDGVEQPVEIRRDRWGVPHVHAWTDHDLWFGQGFCHGQDRLWQIELLRRIATGRLAEIAGTEGVAADRFIRTLGLHRASEREAVELEDGVAAAFEAYCAGVNAAAGSAAAPPAELQILRVGFVPYRPAEMLAMTKLLAFGLSTNWERELVRADLARELGSERAARLDPAYPAGHPVASTPGEAWTGEGLALADQVAALREALGLAPEATGSNNWAVAPSRSATGAPLLAGDPHLPPSMPGITYQVGLYREGRFCRGASFPGRIGIVCGHNNDVAWSVTNTMADVMDLFVERIDGDTYEFEGERRPLELLEERIGVRGQPEAESLTVRATHHGPIVNDALRADPDEPLALRWSALDAPCVTQASLAVLDATSGPELLAALEPHNAPVSNLVWADRHGSIGLKTIGRVPVRRGGCPDVPKPGWTGEHEWEGWIPYRELPELTDPEPGFVVTANNRIEPPGYPHHITSEYLDGYRARRIEALIEAAGEHDLDGFQRMQTDMVSIPGLETARRLARLHPDRRDGLRLGQREVAAIERLRSWDGQMTADSVAATIYQAFTLQLARTVARGAIGDRDLAERWLDRSDNGFTTHVSAPWRWQSHLLSLWREEDPELVGRPWQDLVVDSLRSALDGLEKRFGREQDEWRWGRVHPLVFPHPLGAANPVLRRIFTRRLEVGGAQETVAQVGWDPGSPFTAIWAPSWRIVADPSNPDGARWQQFSGQSGHPASRHFDDLQARWLRGEMQPTAGEGPWRALELVPGA